MENDVRARRLALGMSVRELARLTGLSPNEVSRIERGLSEPKVRTAFRLADALRSDVRELFPDNE